MRSLLRTPGFAIAAVAVLALGVAACTVVFSIIDAVYFRALPFRDPNSLVLIRQIANRPGCAAGCDIPAPAALPAGVAAAAQYWSVLSTSQEITYGVGAAVSGNFFSTLGVQPLIGRLLTAADDQPGASAVMVLDYTFWRNELSGDSTVLGRSVKLDGRPYTIVGVLSPEAGIGKPLLIVDDPTTSATVPFFIPIGSSELGKPQRPERQFRFIARAEMAARVAPLVVDGRPIVASVRHVFSKEYGGAYPVFLGAVLLVLAIACGNLAGLFLVRFHARRRSIAIFAALGAGRVRLARQFIAEPLLVALIGCALGVMISYFGIAAVHVLPARGLPYWTRIAIDWRVLFFAATATAFCAVLFGVAPAIMAANTDATSLLLRESGGSSTSNRNLIAARRNVVVLEIAATLVLITSAGLLGETFLFAAGRDIGISKTHLATGLLDVHALDPSAILDRLARLPGVVGVGMRGGSAESAPPGLSRDGDSAMTEPISAFVVSPGYFRVTGTRVVHGREFTPFDGPDAPPVVLVSDSTARRLFPRENPIGRRVKFGPPSSPSPWMTIVGVVREMGQGLYRPVAQAPTVGMRIMVRTLGPSDAIIPAFRATVRSIVPDAPLIGVTTIDAVVDRQLAPLRVNATVMVAFAVLALIVAALGIYGVVAYLVEQRTEEIGIRMALGARGGDVLLLNLRGVVGMLVFGIAGGLAGSFMVSGLLRAMIYDTSPTDPRVFTAATAVLVAITMLAAYVPARRAVNIDPVRALRGV